MSTITNTTLLADMQVAQDIINQLGADRFTNVTITGNSSTRGIALHPVDQADGATVAAHLGLAPLYLHGDFRTWCGDVRGVPVTVFGDPGTDDLWTFTVTNDSDPTYHYASQRWALTEADIVATARAEYGQTAWVQSGGNEYAYVDQYGHSGYVYVNRVATTAAVTA